MPQIRVVVYVWFTKLNNPWADIWLPSGKKHNMSFSYYQIGSFCPKLRCFTGQNGPNGGPHENEFWKNVKKEADTNFKP